MKSPLLLLSVFGCLAGAALAAEPDASPASSPAPGRHHHHLHKHSGETAAPAESPAPKKHWTLESVMGPARFASKKPVYKHTPAPAPTASAPSPAAPAETSHRWSLGKLNPFAHHPKTAEPSPSPVPGSTPHEKSHKHHKRTTESAAEPTPASTGDEATPAPAPPEEPQATPAPKPKRKGSAITSQVPFVAPEGAQAEKPRAAESTRSPVADAVEQTKRFQEVKSKALADEKVRDLQAKADNASGDEEHTALRQYYKALYSRMREIDPSLHERIQRTEAASLRRAGQ